VGYPPRNLSDDEAKKIADRILSLGAALQGWKSEDLDRAVRKCHHDAAIKKDGYFSPLGLECWVSDNKSLVAVWPSGTKQPHLLPRYLQAIYRPRRPSTPCRR
jgi:hypothetical protein